MSAEGLLEHVLGEPRLVLAGDGLERFWGATRADREKFTLPIDAAVAGGFSADRLAYAFASGYEAALHALVAELDRALVGSFCVTEEAGNHPRAIQTVVESGASRVVLRGKKRWSTMAPLADVLVVVARAAVGTDGRPNLKAVMVPRAARGLTVTTMAPTPFVPEVPHAELSLDGVELDESAVLPGDGYADFVKPFRTVEDLHVRAAALGYLLSVAARFGFPREFRERLIALVVAARSIAVLDSRKAETHIALAGFLSEIAEVDASLEPHWARVEDAERQRWYRDRMLVQVASKARDRRRERAWERLGAELVSGAQPSNESRRD
jgi:acyl-CoA dehydrogenase